MRVFYRIFPGSNPLNVIFRIIFISSILFFLFANKGGRSMGFLWALVYMGGMLIVFLYLIFLTIAGKGEGKGELIKSNENEILKKSKKSSIFYLIIIMRGIVFFFFKLNFWGGRELWEREIVSMGLEAQEFYRLFISISYKPIFRILLLIIRISLFLYLGILNKKILQSKISFFFHFIINSYMKLPILRSLNEK